MAPQEPLVGSDPDRSTTRAIFTGRRVRGAVVEYRKFGGTYEVLAEPSGYQTPSPNFAYGTGPKESLNKEYNPAAGKYGE